MEGDQVVMVLEEQNPASNANSTWLDSHLAPSQGGVFNWWTTQYFKLNLLFRHLFVFQLTRFTACSKKSVAPQGSAFIGHLLEDLPARPLQMLHFLWFWIVQVLINRGVEPSQPSGET